MARLTWTHDSGETADGICASCADDDDGTDCTTPDADIPTTHDMGDLDDGSAYCYCGHVVIPVIS